MKPLRAITLGQPMASAWLDGVKPWENRSRPILRSAVGEWIAVHAAKRDWPCDEAEFRELWPDCPPFGELPRGALLGVLLVGPVVSYPEHAGPTALLSRRTKWLISDPWAFGPYCAYRSDSRVLEEPIPCRGMLGLWKVPEDLAGPLRALIPGGTA